MRKGLDITEHRKKLWCVKQKEVIRQSQSQIGQGRAGGNLPAKRLGLKSVFPLSPLHPIGKLVPAGTPAFF